ncbi:hypothetical protein HMI55_004877 [Coelomomyces lativittatus]|nr:hypothetical protein HMI55_004877 [Coelomomyces lativittatus]
MGVPKFFRWISERFPVCSQLVEKYRIPEFDNLYLDMNGIIHNCSHDNDAEIDLKIPEEKIFEKVCVYIEKLFSIIQPQKVFFLAIDGVAPRAKMNQQRARRFRSSQENVKKKLEMEEKINDSIDENDLFDSNCITPGTEFMEQLSIYLDGFIKEKMVSDPLWKRISVILSGHDVPGEGEHKIMDYIRALKSSPNHDPNTRHCLYGLDADLIMLSLVTHEPHFCLLREEVKFSNPKDSKSNKSIIMKQKWTESEAQRFYLIHISLLREYLDMEFSSLKMDLGDMYTLENVIDDFILLCIFIGNDFLPHLPHLHIHESALSHLLSIYKDLMISNRHYINLQGKLHLPTLLRFLEKMIELEKQALERHLENDEEDMDSDSDSESLVELSEEMDEIQEDDEDLLKRGEELGRKLSFKKGNVSKNSSSSTLHSNTPGKKYTVRTKECSLNSISPQQRSIVECLYTFILTSSSIQISLQSLDEFFLIGLCSKLQLKITSLAPGSFLIEKLKDPLNFNGTSIGQDAFGNDFIVEDSQRLLEKYMRLPISHIPLTQPLNKKLSLEEMWARWKTQYYIKKLEFPKDDLMPKIHQLACDYIRGLQWVLSYYYEGLVSWSWYFPYHYTPFISDLVELSPENIKLEFELGEPFSPFEQLLSVLPPSSGKFLPEPLRKLMYLPDFEKFFPEDFETDFNGKKHDWEKVIKLPFIDQDLFAKKVQSNLHLLSPEELHRNQLNAALIYQWNPKSSSSKKKSTSPLFQNIVKPYEIKKPSTLFKGPCAGIVPRAGFPSLRYLKTNFYLGFHGVNIFGRKSVNESLVVNVHPKTEDTVSSACRFIGRRLYFQWPYLLYGLVVAVGSENVYYEKKSNRNMTPDEVEEFSKRKKMIDRVYYNERGIILPPMNIMLYVRKFERLKRLRDFSKVCEFASRAQWVAWDLALPEVPFEDPRVLEHPPLPLHLEYAVNTEIYLLNPNLCYGAPGKISRVHPKSKEVDGHFLLFENTHLLHLGHENMNKYASLSDVAYDLQLPPKIVSKLTGSIKVEMNSYDTWDLGLKVKIKSKNLIVPGYTRFEGENLVFSEDCYNLIYDFLKSFPTFCRKLSYDPKNGLYKPLDFHPEEPKALAHLALIKEWIDNKLPPMPLMNAANELMTQKEIFKLEKAFENSPDRHFLNDGLYSYFTHVPLSYVLKPDLASLILENQRISLGDRVLNISATGQSCVGAYGYVVGILENKRIQVRQDTSFRGGTDLGGRCAPNHGVILDWYEVLNLTQPVTLPSSQPSNISSSTSSTIKVRSSSRSSVYSHQDDMYRPQHPSLHTHPSTVSYANYSRNSGPSQSFRSPTPSNISNSEQSAQEMTNQIKNLLHISPTSTTALKSPPSSTNHPLSHSFQLNQGEFRKPSSSSEFHRRR